MPRRIHFIVTMMTPADDQTDADVMAPILSDVLNCSPGANAAFKEGHDDMRPECRPAFIVAHLDPHDTLVLEQNIWDPERIAWLKQHRTRICPTCSAKTKVRMPDHVVQTTSWCPACSRVWRERRWRRHTDTPLWFYVTDAIPEGHHG